MTLLNLSGISKIEKGIRVLHNISFSQLPRQKIAIAGETGSGKSTLLKVIAGFVQPDEGVVMFVGDKVVGPYDKLIPGHKGIKYLSQQFELPRFLTVGQVLEYANELSQHEAELLFSVCRIQHLMLRRTNELSGGEQQRIAIAHLLVSSPQLLLLDEPFSNLDAIHKQILKEVIRDIGDRLNITCILVSHDPADLLSWADEIIVLKNGLIQQKGTPFQVYHQPNSVYIAALFGNYNLVSAKRFYPAIAASLNNATQIFVRPALIELVTGGQNALPALVMQVNFMGNTSELQVLVNDTVLFVHTTLHQVKQGHQIYVSLPQENLWHLNATE